MSYIKQNELLLNKLLEYYKLDNNINMTKMLNIINGESRISLRIVDWFATNYAKKHYTVIPVNNNETTIPPNMFGQMPNNFNPYNVLNNEQINTFLQNLQFMNMMNQMMNDPEVCSLMMESMMNPALLNDPTFMQRLTSNQNYMQLLANNMGLFNMNNMFGQMPSANFNSTNNTFLNTDVSNPNNSTNQYEKEIDEMVELGFPNRASNLQALQICNGDVNRAINMLLDMY